MNPTTALYNFLFAQLKPAQLRRWLDTFPGGATLLGELPGDSVGAAQLLWEATDLLHRQGFLRQDDTWDRLLEVLPNFKAELDALKTKFLPNARPTQALVPKDGQDQTSPSTPTPPQKQPQQIKILLVSSCPDDQDRLRVDREFRDIIDKLAKHRARVRVEQINAATFDSLCTALLEHEPHVLHISCHGTPGGDLLFESEQGATQKIPKRTMIDLFKTLTDNLRLVFLNGCDTDQLAREIPKTIDLAVGMRHPITDAAAIELSVAFYEALAFSKPVATAFALGLVKLGKLGTLSEDRTPELFPPADADPDNKRKQKLVEL